MEFSTVYIPEFDPLRDILLRATEELIFLRTIVGVSKTQTQTRVAGSSVDVFCVVLLIFYVLEILQSRREGKIIVEWTLSNLF